MSDSGRIGTYSPAPPRRYDLVSSTQDLARDLAREQGEKAVGAVITALRMSAGRGRQGRTWHAPPGANVCLTTILPAVPLDRAWELALVAGIAAAESIRDVLPDADPRLRFPNDVQIGTKKAGGILVEVDPASAPGRVYPLVGIGINVHAAPLPPEVAERATSLETAAGTRLAVATVEAALLERLRLRFAEWAEDGLAATLPVWSALHDPAAARTFVLNGRPRRCRVLDLFETGQVTLEDKSGERHTLHAAQVILGDD